MKCILLAAVIVSIGAFGQVEPPKVEFPEFEKPQNDAIFCPCSVDAQFPGGLAQMKRHFLNYKHKGWYGEDKTKRGYIGFTIEKDGSLMDIHIIRGISTDLDDLMLRMVEEMPRWIPGYDSNGPVSMHIRLPVTFSYPKE
ncbi:MAG: energy transducer TonB [Crocinitomicaceae bacterium]